MIALPPLLRLLLVGLCACASSLPPSAAAPSPAVAWQDWSRTTFDRAAREHKYLLLSIQTEWCHWCHVMNDVTYRDPEVLALLAQHFVVVRADADQRPDLAERYARWGWPATGILTPEGEPILNLKGYREPRAFSRVLQDVVALGAKAAHAPAAAISGAPEQPADLRAQLQSARAILDASWDESQAGWGTPQKYPRTAPVELAWLRAFVAEDATQRAHAERALAGYARLIDPVWGGMFQYSVHGDWTHPHFEKIHAVQASSIESFVQAYRATRDAGYLEHARNIERFVMEHLLGSDGAFYANQDADVGRPQDAFHRTGAEFYALDAAGRAQTQAPSIDRQIYASYNGMTIAALARLHEATLDPKPLAAAARALAVLERDHRRGAGYTHGAHDSDGLLYLTDQTEVSRALLALYEVTGDARYRTRLHELLDFVLATLQDPHGGFYAHSLDPAAPGSLATPRKPIGAGARLARVLLWAARLEGPSVYRDAAERALRAMSERAALLDERRDLGEYVLALEEQLAPYAVITVVGDEGAARSDLAHAALLTYAPNRRVHIVTPADTKYPYPGKPVAYLCSDDACSLPIADPTAIATGLADALRTRN